jgi:hypothetical protein
MLNMMRDATLAASGRLNYQWLTCDPSLKMVIDQPPSFLFGLLSAAPFFVLLATLADGKTDPAALAAFGRSALARHAGTTA